MPRMSPCGWEPWAVLLPQQPASPRHGRVSGSGRAESGKLMEQEAAGSLFKCPGTGERESLSFFTIFLAVRRVSVLPQHTCLDERCSTKGEFRGMSPLG